MGISRKRYRFCDLVFFSLGAGIGVVTLGIVLAGCGGPEGAAAVPAERVESPFVGPFRGAEFLKATEVYGPLYLTAGDFERKQKLRPWTSYWFPKKDPVLFRPSRSEPAPLQKYDRFAANSLGRRTRAAAYEESVFNPEGEDTWAGLCDAWASASILAAEPAKPVTIDGIRFSVLDLKGLLIKSHELVEGKKYFGQRYLYEGRSEIQDLYPDQFHRILQAELMDRGRPFIMDKDPGMEVWNTPVSAAQIRIRRDPSDPHVMHVMTHLLGTVPSFSDLHFVGQDAYWFEYTYDLFGNDGPEGFKVEFGLWTGNSEYHHPDFITVLPAGAAPLRKSLNPELDSTIVDEILGRSD